MHMFYASIARLIKQRSILSPCFCATLLFHRAKNMKTLEERIQANMIAAVSFEYEPLSADDRMYNERLLGLLDMIDFAASRECSGFGFDVGSGWMQGVQ
eukprot:7604959-Alexandrium_andersonii.AAC.1